MRIARILPIAFVLVSACGTSQKELGATATDEASSKSSTQTASVPTNTATPSPLPTLTARDHFLRAADFYNQDLIVEAIEEYSIAIELDEDYQTAYELRGALYGMLREFDNGIVDLSEAIALDPENAELYKIRGNLFFDKAYFEEDPGSSILALDDLSKAIEYNPRLVEAHYLKGQVNHEIGVYSTELFLTNFLEDAIEDFTNVIALQPDHALAYYFRAIDYGLLSDDRMIADLEMAIELGLDPEREKTARDTLEFVLGSD